jgi:hypothetical protein
MYISNRSKNFLLLLQPTKATIGETCCEENIFAVVRKVTLSQFGNFMMGRANINGKWKTVSGAYGSDGLPMEIDALPKDAVKLPSDLYNAWKDGGGWNSCGNEAAAMCQWARETFKKR